MTDRSRTWNVRHYVAFMLLILLAAVALTAAGCTKNPTDPSATASPGPPTAGCVVTGSNNTVNCGNGNTVTPPAASPSPGSGTLPTGATVKIGAFGQSCPASVLVPADGHVLKLTCQTAITCTPKDGQGVPLPPSVTGSKPDFFGVKNGVDIVSANPWEDEAFNLNVIGKREGEFDLGCVVKGASADLWHGQVVKADAVGFRVILGPVVIYDQETALRFGFSLRYGGIH